jgi:hypothetical protein
MRVQLVALAVLAAYFVWTGSLAGVTADLVRALGL